MTTKILSTISTLTLIIGTSLPALAASADQLERSVTVSVYDRAHISPKSLEQAQRIATRIFSEAGVTIRWRTRPIPDNKDLVEDFSAPAGRTCNTPLRSNSVQVQILPDAPRGFTPQALAYSLPCADYGVQTTVYADRVEAVSNQTLAVFYRVLGYTLTHELGHLLLRSLAHEHSGLMKAVWTPKDWQRAAVSIIPFTPDQATGMAKNVDRDLTAKAIECCQSADARAGPSR